MSRRPTPTLRRKELGVRLKRLRLDRGMTLDDVASALMVSVTKISRLETGSRGVNPRDIRDLCGIYSVDPDERDQLMELVRQSREPSWWQQYDSEYATWLELEAAATSISDYKIDILPGLLQTQDYTRAVGEAALPDVNDQTATLLAEFRQERQKVLTGDIPVEFWAVIDEAAVRRLIGGPGVMRDQVEVLIDHASQPNINIQIIPFATGAHPALNSTFTILQFDEQSISDVVYVEGLAGQQYLQGPKDVVRYRRVFDQLRAMALGPRDTIGKLVSIAKDLANQSDATSDQEG